MSKSIKIVIVIVILLRVDSEVNYTRLISIVSKPIKVVVVVVIIGAVVFVKKKFLSKIYMSRKL